MARTDEHLARHYARAFLQTILEMKGEEVLPAMDGQLKELSMLSAGEGGAFLESPLFDPAEKFEVLDTYLVQHALDPTLGRFAKLLISEGQIHLFPVIVEQFSEVLREHRNEAVANIRTAFPLRSEEEERLGRALGKTTGKKILMNVEIDPTLIGGVVAEVGGTVFDASIRGYLDRLQEEFQT